MSSQISAIYAALAAQTVTAGNIGTVNVYTLDTLQATYDTMRLPCRLILPDESNGADEFAWIAYGTTGKVLWRIHDIFLYRTVNSGRGPMDAIPDLIAYQGAYTEMVRHTRLAGGLIRSVATIEENWTMRRSTITYPANSGNSFHAVECHITVSEYLTGAVS